MSTGKNISVDGSPLEAHIAADGDHPEHRPTPDFFLQRVTEQAETQIERLLAAEGRHLRSELQKLRSERSFLGLHLDGLGFVTLEHMRVMLLEAQSAAKNRTQERDAANAEIQRLRVELARSHNREISKEGGRCLCMLCEDVRAASGENKIPPPALRAALGKKCRACNIDLDVTNWHIADGCPCNSERGVNHGLVPRETCTCVSCDPHQSGSSRYGNSFALLRSMLSKISSTGGVLDRAKVAFYWLRDNGYLRSDFTDHVERAPGIGSDDRKPQ